MYKKCIVLIVELAIVAAIPPNIILIVADDLGWNDFGFHGSNQIPTPNVDAFAYNGQVLNRHYTLTSCTPSRAALLTGKYPMKIGMQGEPLRGIEAAGLPLSETLLPQYLKNLGYVSRLVGKWHLGFFKEEYTPTRRGFDSFFGYYNGFVRYNDSVYNEINSVSGFDARKNLNHAAHIFRGRYVTDVFTDEAVEIIREHDVSRPLFLQLSHAAVHSCQYNVLQVKNEAENDAKFGYIKDKRRRLYAGMLSSLDESVGHVIEALGEKKMLRNSILLVMSDNGGATETDNYNNTASNWPLRGMKMSLMEGGVRCAAAFWSPFTPSSQVLNGLIHISDWLPTLYSAAGGNVSDLGNIDGINQWDYLRGMTMCPRNQILLNINEKTNEYAVISNKWKYVRMNGSSARYTGITGREEKYGYDMEKVLRSTVHRSLSNFSSPVSELNVTELFEKIRDLSKIDKRCRRRIEQIPGRDNVTLDLFCQSGCLFNIQKDPCEFDNLRVVKPEVTSSMLNLLAEFRRELVPQIRRISDARANPKYWNNYWTSWQSYFSDGEQNRSYAISMYLFSSTFLLISGLQLSAIV